MANRVRVPHNYKVGDAVSYSFNGDTYPDGYVAKITAKYLTTTTGAKYYLRTTRDRVKIDGEYEDVDREYWSSIGHGTWALCHGHINERNPHF